MSSRSLHGWRWSLLVLVLAASPAQAQICTGNVDLTSQAAVDAFACTEVTGGVDIHGSDIDDLTPLTGLTSVGAYLRIRDNPALTSLSGLDALISVTDNFFIQNNDALTSLSGLDALTSVGGFFVRDNGALTSLSGLDALTSVGGRLEIVRNPALTSLSGLNALTSGTYISLNIQNNASLTSLSGLENFTSVEVFEILIISNPVLTSCSCGLAGFISGDPPQFKDANWVVIIGDNDPAGQCTSPEVVLATPCNTAPTNVVLAAPFEAQPVNTPVSVSASFTDPDDADTHSAVWDWGDTTECDTDDTDPAPDTCTVNQTDDTVTGTHTYTAPGVYTLALDVTEEAGATVSGTFQYLVVYDPTGGFVTGGGWITSPAGAYAPDPALAGTARFGFVSKYKKGKSTPDGTTQFEFEVAALAFASTSYDWLVIAGSKAKFKGEGTINDAGSYGFMLTATDGDPDLFRIKIWDKADGDAVVYDNQMGAADDSDAGTTLGGGQIKIHDGNGHPRLTDAGETAQVAEVAEMPAAFALTGNYPNPFNPQTTIGFELPESVLVRLAVYDVLGRQVAVLVDGPHAAGVHQVVFEAGSLPSGMYLVRLETPQRSVVQTIQLVK